MTSTKRKTKEDEIIGNRIFMCLCPWSKTNKKEISEFGKIITNWRKIIYVYYGVIKKKYQKNMNDYKSGKNFFPWEIKLFNEVLEEEGLDISTIDLRQLPESYYGVGKITTAMDFVEMFKNFLINNYPAKYSYIKENFHNTKIYWKKRKEVSDSKDSKSRTKGDFYINGKEKVEVLNKNKDFDAPFCDGYLIRKLHSNRITTYLQCTANDKHIVKETEVERIQEEYAVSFQESRKVTPFKNKDNFASWKKNKRIEISLVGLELKDFNIHLWGIFKRQHHLNKMDSFLKISIGRKIPSDSLRTILNESEIEYLNIKNNFTKFIKIHETLSSTLEDVPLF